MPVTSTTRLPLLTIRGIRTSAVEGADEVPARHQCGHCSQRAIAAHRSRDRGGDHRPHLPVLLPHERPPAIDIVLRDAVSVVKGEPVAPLDIGAKLARRFALVGVASVVRMALCGLDAALWDALAVAAGLPLATFLGAKPKLILAYNSSGLGLMPPEAAADEAEKLLAGGFLSVKLRLGHPNLEQDLAVTRAVRKRLPDAIELPVDYNQALTVAEAIRRGRALEGEGVAWLEEPIRHDDYAGNATVARTLAVSVQIGENFNGPEAMVEALAARACDYVMPDAARIGGVSGWIQAAGIAAAPFAARDQRDISMPSNDRFSTVTRMSVVETWPEHEHHRIRCGGFIGQVASHTDGKITKRGYHAHLL